MVQKVSKKIVLGIIFRLLTLMLGKFLTVLRVCSQQKGVTSTGIALSPEKEIQQERRAAVKGTEKTRA